MHTLAVIAGAIVSIVLMAFGRRLRGGLWNSYTHLGTQTSRLLWWGCFSAIVTLIGFALSGRPLWWAAAAIPLAWSTSTLPMFGSIDLGHNEGSYWRDLLFLCAQGILEAAPLAGAGFLLHLPGWPILLLGGALQGPTYALAWIEPLPFDGFGGKPPGQRQPPEAGELLHGATFGLALFLAAYI
jgi:hypothetical protein